MTGGPFIKRSLRPSLKVPSLKSDADKRHSKKSMELMNAVAQSQMQLIANSFLNSQSCAQMSSNLANRTGAA